MTRALSLNGANGKALTSEILIVGAGPVGLTLANILGLRGVKTMLVDRKSVV